MNRNSWLFLSKIPQNFLRSKRMNSNNFNDTKFKLPSSRKFSSSFPKWALFSVPVITFGLGTWQVQRKQWKKNLIKQLEDRRFSAPTDLPKDLRDLGDMEYVPIRVTGTFDHDKEMYICSRMFLDPKSKNPDAGGLFSNQQKVGFHVVTPLYIPERGFSILVNRGFVLRALRSPDLRQEGQVEGPVVVTGLVRLSEKRKTFLKNFPEDREYFYRDVNGMAQSCNTAPIFIDADHQSTIPGGPIGGQTRVQLRDEHLSYLITWYSLSAISGSMWYLKFIKTAL